jgi:hypothetical protein
MPSVLIADRDHASVEPERELLEAAAVELRVGGEGDADVLVVQYAVRAAAHMAAGRVLVNISRGGLVDSAAVLEALESGRLAGAALEHEPPEGAERGLTRHPRAIVTPHAA